jgi:hypothetical protein
MTIEQEQTLLRIVSSTLDMLADINKREQAMIGYIGLVDKKADMVLDLLKKTPTL